MLFIGGPSQPTALVIKAAREQGFKGGFIVMDQAKFEQMDQVVPVSYLNGSVGVLPTKEFFPPSSHRRWVDIRLFFADADIHLLR